MKYLLLIREMLKKTWKIINSILKRNNKHKKVHEFEIVEETVTGEGDIAEHFNDFFY